MSRDLLTVGSTMRIPLLYRGEYSQWVERFMNYLEKQTDEEAMINSIKNDKSIWSDQEKRVQKIDRLARSLLIQGLSNDIYSLIDSNKTAKDLWDALARHMLSSEYGEQVQFLLSIMDANFNNETDPWEFGLDVDDSDLTPSLRSSNSTHVESSTLIQNLVTIIVGPAGVVQLSSNTRAEPYPSTPNPVRIIPGTVGIVQQAKLLREKVFILDSDEALMSTQKYMQKIIKDVGEDDDFNSEAWVSATNYVMAFGGTVTGCLRDIDNFLKKGKT
nr:hypothetical protein [Tanacetum cinerariifolium]